ncbi:MAG: hypothetical protein ACRC2R_23985 [Xenococcaceae cyanobacterium]
MGYQNSLELLLVVKEEVDNVLESIYSTNYARYVIASELRLQLAYYVLERLQKKADRNSDRLRFIFGSNKIPARSLELRLVLEKFIFEALKDFCQLQKEPIASKHASNYSSKLSVLSRKELN